MILLTALTLVGAAAAETFPPVPHVTTDPMFPQKYRAVPPGKYPCSVVISVDAAGKATEIEKVACDEDAYWALAAAILQWRFDAATDDGVPVASKLPYTSVFEVKTLLPRKHIVGFIGGALSTGGLGYFGAEGRVHLGETLSLSFGADWDRDILESNLEELWAVGFRGDVTVSTPRQHFKHRGIYGLTLGGYVDTQTATGLYAAFRGKLMTGVPGLSVGGDLVLATLFNDPPTYDDVGVFARWGTSPIYPWIRASLIWYAPLPRDQFIVVPREDDPVVYEPVIPPPEDVPDIDGRAFEGVPAIHWSEIEPSIGDITPTGPGFAEYPPGSYVCNVRVLVGEDGAPRKVRVEKCPEAGRADAEATVRMWRWRAREGKGDVQAVFPAPIFVDRDDAELIRYQQVQRLVDGAPKALPRRTPQPEVYVHERVPPMWGITLPTRTCFVDVDLDAHGKLAVTKWVSGDIEVRPRVEEALAKWRFYPVAIDGELTPVRVRLVMCDE